MAHNSPQSFTHFGSLLRHLRQCARLTQDELGLAVGYSRAHVARLESGQRAPDPGIVRARFAEALGLRDAPEVAARLFALADAAHALARDVECPTSPATQATVARIPNNLPARVTSFIGRERELDELLRLLSGTRLLTLTGAGGAGKTRLAIELAKRLAQAEASEEQLPTSFPDGVWWIELAPVSDPAHIPRAVATVLGVREESARPLLASLLTWLRDRRLLLILDNCEHLLDACAQFADAVLRAGEGLRLLATSRERLGVPGELTWRVPSLSTPAADDPLAPEKLAGYEAVRLFVDRAQRVQPGFALTPAEGPAVQHIVTHLDGIPLALELAAARLNALTARDIAAHLDDRFHLLTSGNRAALPRHRTLRACVDWSYDLLAEPERVLLRRLAVFAGGWTLDAARQICADEAGSMAGVHPASFVLHRSQVLDALMRLVDQSLVVVDESGIETRFHVLETIRQYALEKLAETDEEAHVRERHLGYYLRIGQHMAQSFDEYTPANQVYLAKQAAVELDNARRALEWVAEAGRFEEACKMAGAWAVAFILCDLQGEWLARARNLLARGANKVSSPAQAAVLIRVADVHLRQGEFDQANAALDQAEAIALALDDSALRCEVELSRATIALMQSRPAEARSHYEQWRELVVAGNVLDDGGLAKAESCMLGNLAFAEQDYPEAQRQWTRHLSLLDPSDINSISTVTRNLGYVLLYLGNDAEAATRLRESLIDNRAMGMKQAVAACVAGFGALALARGDLDRAARLFGASEAITQATHTPLMVSDANQVARNMSLLRERMDEATLNAALAEGRAMTLQEAVDAALALVNEPAS